MEIIKEITITGMNTEEFGAKLVSEICKVEIHGIAGHFALRIDNMQLENGRVDCCVWSPKFYTEFVYVLFTYYQAGGIIKCHAQTHDWSDYLQQVIPFSGTYIHANKLINQVFEHLSNC